MDKTLKVLIFAIIAVLIVDIIVVIRLKELRDDFKPITDIINKFAPQTTN